MALDEYGLFMFEGALALGCEQGTQVQGAVASGSLLQNGTVAAFASLPDSADDDADLHLLETLLSIVEQRSLTAVFQPIVQMQNGSLLGYEGLIRGPLGSPLHSPISLFNVARTHNLSVQVEHLCRRVVLERFVELGLPGKLFLNVSPESLISRTARHGETLAYIHQIGFDPGRVIIELTESSPTYDYELLRKAALHYRDMGFEIAIDDLGEGFSSLRLWSELRPEYVKIDMHFIQGINTDPIKLQFVQSIQEIAHKSGSTVIAEGIETEAELLAVRDLGIACGQGYHIARPQAEPTVHIAESVRRVLEVNAGHSLSCQVLDERVPSARKLLRVVPMVTSQMSSNSVFEIFSANPNLQIVPVVDDGIPVGLINRHRMIECFARPYQRELYGRRPCTHFMVDSPLVVDQHTGLPDLSHRVAQADAHHLFNGFIITGEGRYLGMGSGHDLMREITQMQIQAARYANPLTQLPGNVPINEQIDLLLQQNTPFCACYCDLDNFKPFNDAHGYHRGDEVIRMTAKILGEQCEPGGDFIGHIGGDDFMILFVSQDWEIRCNRILSRFGHAIQDFYSPEERKLGGYLGEDRQGRKVFYPLISMSLGVTHIASSQLRFHHQVAEAAAEAKKQAKKIHGNSLFVERRGKMGGVSESSSYSTQR